MSKCTYCHRPIRESTDPGVPFVHADSGNSFCDVTTPESAVRLAGTRYRHEAEPVTVLEEAERLLGYWEQHGDNTEAVSKWAVSDLLAFVRLTLDTAEV